MHIAHLPPISLKSDSAAGLYIYYDEDRAQGLRECLTADEADFSLNPPEATHLAVPGKATFVFGHGHPRLVAQRLEMVGEEVTIDRDVMIPEDQYQPPVSLLLSLGEVRRDEERDYAALGILQDHVSALIRMATDGLLHQGPTGSPVVWAPVHAWRALVQLRAEDAIVPLVELFQRADEGIDEWVSGELPKDLAAFGAPALEPLTAYLADATHGEWSRVAAAKAIGHVGEVHVHPNLRLDCIARLSAQLERFADQSDILNAFLVYPLWHLRAVEAMPVIERAFTSGQVDETVLGDLEDVQIHFDLKTQREHPPKPNKLTILGEQLRAQWTAAGLPLPRTADDFFGPEDDFPEWETESPPTITLPHIAPPKIGRNEPCPCGSGKKYKKCCGA